MFPVLAALALVIVPVLVLRGLELEPAEVEVVAVAEPTNTADAEVEKDQGIVFLSVFLLWCLWVVRDVVMWSVCSVWRVGVYPGDRPRTRYSIFGR